MNSMKSSDQKIYLASKSSRRRELLRQIGVEFEMLLLRDRSPSRPSGPDVSEEVEPGEAALDYVARVTREKAQCAQHIMFLRKLPIRSILAADTTVAIDQQILGKPADMADATHMLKLLSGRTHQVLTSIAVLRGQDLQQVTQISEVTFTELSDEAIGAYCASGEPYDKAGSYGIQGMAALFVKHMTGSYTGIMGLPLFETAQLLRQVGIHIP